MELTQKELFEKNMKLVTYVYTKLLKASQITKNNKDDIMQEGYLGLLHACQRFDESKGNFSTFATKYILGTMKKYIYKLYKNDAELILQDTIFHDNEETTIEDTLGDNKDDRVKVFELAVKDVVSKNTATTQKIVYMSMYCKNQEEVAEKLDVSQAYVSKVLKKIKTQVKELLEL